MKYPSIFYYFARSRYIITAYLYFPRLIGTLLPEMSNLLFKTPEEIQVELGSRLRRLRLDRNLDQISTAEKAGISEKALRNLESGHGSTVETLVRVLKALDFSPRHRHACAGNHCKPAGAVASRQSPAPTRTTCWITGRASSATDCLLVTPSSGAVGALPAVGSFSACPHLQRDGVKRTMTPKPKKL